MHEATWTRHSVTPPPSASSCSCVPWAPREHWPALSGRRGSTQTEHASPHPGHPMCGTAAGAAVGQPLGRCSPIRPCGSTADGLLAKTGRGQWWHATLQKPSSCTDFCSVVEILFTLHKGTQLLALQSKNRSTTHDERFIPAKPAEAQQYLKRGQDGRSSSFPSNCRAVYGSSSAQMRGRGTHFWAWYRVIKKVPRISRLEQYNLNSQRTVM